MAVGDVLRGSPRLISNLYVGVLVAVYAVIGILVAPALYSDSGWGFLVADSMERGGPFNHLLEPDEENIARDKSWFVALWSPAQYVLPHALERLGLPLGSALIIIATLFTASGLVGWQVLYRSWGFPPLTVAIALVVMASSRATALPFGIYNGGEVLLFGSAPWFLLLLGRWSALALRHAVGVLIAGAIIVLVKLSGLVLVLAALAATVVYDLWPPSLAKLRRPVMAAAIVVALGAAFHLLWLSRGMTTVAPGNDMVWAESPFRFAQGCAAAVFGMFSLGDLLRRIFQQPPHPLLDSVETLYLVGAIPSIALMFFVYRRLRATHRDYVRFTLAMGLFYIAIMAAIFVHDGGGLAFMEDRFYRPLSLTLLIGAVHAVAVAGAALRVPLAALAALSVAYGVTSYFARVDHNLRSPLGARGIRHHILSHDGLALIRQELAGPFERADTVIWVIAPEIAFELPQMRVIPTGEAPEDLTGQSYNGRVGKLFILVPATMVADGRAGIMLRAFNDYDPGRWTTKSLGDYTLYFQ